MQQNSQTALFISDGSPEVFEVNRQIIEDDGSPPPTRTVRPSELGPVPARVLAAVQLCDRIEAAAVECRRQLLVEEIDTGFVPRDVLRSLHCYVMNDPQTTIAAVTARALTLLFKNYLNIEEVAPEIARMILAGRSIEPIRPSLDPLVRSVWGDPDEHGDDAPDDAPEDDFGDDLESWGDDDPAGWDAVVALPVAAQDGPDDDPPAMSPNLPSPSATALDWERLWSRYAEWRLQRDADAGRLERERRVILKACGFFEGSTPGDVTDADLLRFRAHLKATGLKKRAVEDQTAALNRVLHWGRKRGLAASTQARQNARSLSRPQSGQPVLTNDPQSWRGVPVKMLTDAEWAACRAVLPPPAKTGPKSDPRAVVTALRHRWATGCPWRELPASLGNWSTLYTTARLWMTDGTYRTLRSILMDGGESRAA